jgi:hypothetical protein
MTRHITGRFPHPPGRQHRLGLDTGQPQGVTDGSSGRRFGLTGLDGQFLGNAECDLLARLDLDGFAGRWVPVWRSPLSRDRRTDKAPPVDTASDDGDIFAPIPPSQQTIWPRVGPGL